MNIERSEGTITLNKTYEAPQALVFSMFQNPHIAKWWGPQTWPVNVSNMDFTVGGSWHYSMKGPDGTEVWGKTIYDEIEVPSKIVYRDYFSDAEGAIDTTLPVGLTTVTFEEKDGKTMVTSRGEYESAEAVQKLVDMGMLEGVTDTWTQLEKLLAAMQ